MFVAITDLHETGDYLSTNNAGQMLRRLEPPPEFVVFNGDILYNHYLYDTRWSNEKCQESIRVALEVVSKLGFPFLFTFGNHDVVRLECRSMLATKLSEHSLHIGRCMPGRATCIHPYAPIATIDSLSRGCRGNMASLGCPTKSDVAWIGTHAENGILFTHYPPPAVLRRHVRGFTGEQPCCWLKTREVVLPGHKVHAYGHDHNNMYISKGDHSLIALYKSGIPSYGPSFSDNRPGITVFDANFVPTFLGSDGKNWTFETLPDATVGRRCHRVQSSFLESGWFFGIIVAIILLAATIAFGLVQRCHRKPRKRKVHFAAETRERLLRDEQDDEDRINSE